MLARWLYQTITPDFHYFQTIVEERKSFTPEIVAAWNKIPSPIHTAHKHLQCLEVRIIFPVFA